MPAKRNRSGGSSTSRHLGAEHKFEVAESVAVPRFDDIAPVARVESRPSQTLDARYFDTRGRDLAAHAISLRRRTGGDDGGWQLTLPAQPDAPTEIRAGLGTRDDEVPAELRDVVMAVVRDRPLGPVAWVATNHTVEVLYDANGTALAQFCDDKVTARANAGGAEQHWREWELELAENGSVGKTLLREMSDRLCHAGAVPTRHVSKLARVLGSSATVKPVAAYPDDPVRQAVAEQVERLLVWDRAVRADAADSVHQMRVAIREIRSLLQASETEFGLSDDAEILSELRELATVLGGARDAEVLGQRYERALNELPTELVRGPVRERLVDGARCQYRSGLAKCLSAMRSERYFRLLDGLDALVAAKQSPPPHGGKKAAIRAGYRRVRRRAETAAKADPAHRDVALHQVRKAAKRLRYTAAAVGAVKVADSAKSIQTLLGDHQDSVVSRAHLLQQADAAHAAADDTFTYGLLHQREADLAQRCEQRLETALKTLDKAVHKAL